MTNNDIVLDLIKQKVGDYRVRGKETVFRECPFCGNLKYNFELNMEKGVCACWACGQGYGIRGLLGRLGIQYDGPLPTYYKAVEKKAEVEGELKLPEGLMPIDQTGPDNKAMAYLGSRGITKEDIKTYEIMWWKDQGRVLFPFRNSAGNLIFWTARSIFKNIRPKYYHAAVSKADRIITYYGQDGDNNVFIVEGVFDALRLNKAGKTVIILMGSAISGQLKDYLRASKKDVVLVLDQDAAQKQLEYQEELERCLGKDKVKAIYLPEKDVAAMGLPEKGEREGFGGYIKSRLEKGGMDHDRHAENFGAGTL